jgi:Kef-type K+ transport system membrane component KefB
MARILCERRLLHSRIGTLAFACAAVDDVTGWCMLGALTIWIQAGHTAVLPWVAVPGCVGLVAVLRYGVRPWLDRAYIRVHPDGGLRDSFLAGVCMLMLVCAGITAYLGLHELFGSLLAGAVLPRNDQLARELRQRLEPLTELLLLPLFFAFAGLRTKIGLLHGEMWLTALVIVAAATIGKMGGSAIAARWAGLSWTDAAAVGALLNARGLMGLVVLNIALDLGLITPALFTMMVLMTLGTTVMTAPVLSWLRIGSAAPEVVASAAVAKPGRVVAVP